MNANAAVKVNTTPPETVGQNILSLQLERALGEAARYRQELVKSNRALVKYSARNKLLKNRILGLEERVKELEEQLNGSSIWSRIFG